MTNDTNGKTNDSSVEEKALDFAFRDGSRREFLLAMNKRAAVVLSAHMKSAGKARHKSENPCTSTPNN